MNAQEWQFAFTFGIVAGAAIFGILAEIYK
jgi:hypothetical protein